MLFNTYGFVFGFLPITLAGFFVLGRLPARRWAVAWLVVASLAFYGAWNVAYVPLLAGSVLFNYLVGLRLARLSDARAAQRKALLVAGIAANLGLLAYFKYTDFAISSLNTVVGSTFQLQHIILPLAISFFTFNQIAYLADVHARLAGEYDVVNYAFFVTFFPHLIAGPIVHHAEIMPQLRAISYRFAPQPFAVGLTLFAIGLFEKVALADSLAPIADDVFRSAASGANVGAIWAWTGATTYAFQLFFDFAGYSTMAIGLARMVDIRFPLNFDSPYRAASIIDFWRRWHMTLSRFLRQYLYIPLGGNRHGSIRRYANLMATMVLGGLWHGAAWTFVVWGTLHGVYLCVNHGWETLGRRYGWDRVQRHPVTGVAGYAVTMVAVVVGWVFFRAADLPTALRLCASMAGLHGRLPTAASLPAIPSLSLVAALAVCALLATIAPNAVELIDADKRPGGAFVIPLAWRPTIGWAVAAGALAGVAIPLCSRSSSFIYYQF